MIGRGLSAIALGALAYSMPVAAQGMADPLAGEAAPASVPAFRAAPPVVERALGGKVGHMRKLRSATLLLIMASLASATLAQNVPEQISSAAMQPVGQAAPSCIVKLYSREEGKAGELFAACGQRAIRLGPAIRFSAIFSPTLNRLLIVKSVEAGQRVLMLRPPTDKDSILLEDYTNSIAATARGLRVIQVSALNGEVDISDFVSNGTIKLTDSAMAILEKKNKSESIIMITRDGDRIRLKISVPTGGN